MINSYLSFLQEDLNLVFVVCCHLASPAGRLPVCTSSLTELRRKMPMERKSREERDLSYTAWMDDHDINDDDAEDDDYDDADDDDNDDADDDDNDDDADDDDDDLGRVDG